MGKAREIASAFSQGREYFSAAAQGGLLVRPLLQYYGSLSLSRGLILLLSPNLRETSLPQAHGISSVGWGQALASGPKHTGDLGVKFQKGTFNSLLEYTNNTDISVVFTGLYPEKLIFLREHPIEKLLDASITFQQILARLPELRDIYERTFNAPAANYRAFVYSASPKDFTDIDLYPGRLGLPEQSELRQTLDIPPEAEIESTAAHHIFPPEPHLNYRIGHWNGLNSIERLPQIDNHGDNAMSVVARFPQGFSISRIGRYFLLSFFLGTLARYHPTSWLALMQSRDNGDFMLPLIREAMNVLQDQFPALIIRELES